MHRSGNAGSVWTPTTTSVKHYSKPIHHILQKPYTENGSGVRIDPDPVLVPITCPENTVIAAVSGGNKKGAN